MSQTVGSTSTPPTSGASASPLSPFRDMRRDSSQIRAFSGSQPSLQAPSLAALITREALSANPHFDNSAQVLAWATEYLQCNDDLFKTELDVVRRRRSSRVHGMSSMSAFTQSGSGTMEPEAASATASPRIGGKRGSLVTESSMASSGMGERLMTRLVSAGNASVHGGDSPGSKPSMAPGSPVMSVSLPLPQIEHVESVLEMKAKLRDPRYFTEEQLIKERFHKRSRAVSAIITPLSIAMIFFTAASLAARVGLGSDRLAQSLAWVELVVDCVWFITVTGLGVLMPFEEDGQVVTDLQSIAWRYVSRPWLGPFDVVSHFPALAVLAPLGLVQFEYARVNLLLREARMPMLIEHLEDHLPRTLHPSLMRLISYFLYLLLIITHLSTVFMAVMRYESEHAAAEWVEASRIDAWYWFSRAWREMLTLIAEKRLAYPHEDVEYIASIFLVVCALITISVILASFEEIIVTEIDEGSVLNKKLEATLSTLDMMRVPSHLQHEIVEYYVNMWEINRTFDFQQADVLAELPASLKADVDFECNSRIIRTIPIFSEVAQNPDFVRLLAGQLQQVVVMPGAPIVLKGEEGDCMFFVSSGVACVMDDEGLEEDLDHEDLEAGAFFGEVTMLFGGKRERTIAAKTLCVCSVVTAAIFDRVVDVCPEALQGILNAAVAQIRQVVANQNAAAATAAGVAAEDVASRNNSEMGSFLMRRFSHAHTNGSGRVIAADEQSRSAPHQPATGDEASRPSQFTNMNEFIGVAESHSDHDEPVADEAVRPPDSAEDDSLRDHLAEQFRSRRQSFADFWEEDRRCSTRVTAHPVVHAVE